MKYFLSHSSADKAHYVRIIADRLGDRAVYDEYTFESGMDTMSEIFRTMDQSDIFVLFISNRALESDWVRDEITQSKLLLDAQQLKQFIPILIDRSISHSDSRIPAWIRERYNLRLVARPTVALRRMQTVFSQLAIKRHPLLERQHQLFVGRNDELSQFERRIDDYAKVVPAAVIASGMREVGRKTFLLRALQKSNKIPSSYDPIVLPLHYEDGIEGFISKLYDIGYYPDDVDLGNLIEMSLDEKRDLLADLLTELSRQNEVLLVDDWRCIVRYGGELADWFLGVCERLPPNRIVLAIAAASRPKVPARKLGDVVFPIHLRELDPEERVGLLVRYLREVEGRYDIDPGDYSTFKPALNGYPEQAIFAGQLIASEGLAKASLRMNEIYEFSREKASVYAQRFEDNNNKKSFLEFLSWFEFVSFGLLMRLEKEIHFPLIEYVGEFLDEGICDLIGSVGEYVRLNDIMRDYLARGSISLPRDYTSALKNLSAEMYASGELAEYDYSETYAVARVSLLEGLDIRDRALIPAHFLGAISQKYKNRKYEDVIALCDRILARDNYELYVKTQIRHYLCMALARRRDKRFLVEVQGLSGVEHKYVLGFYYRVMGRYKDAMECFQAATKGRWEENSKREIVLIHNIMENFDEAFLLARESYNKSRTNPIIIQAYFDVLMNTSPRTPDIIAEINSTLEAIEKNDAEKADEVKCSMKARYAYHIDHDLSHALEIIDDGIAQFDSPYPVYTKLELGISAKRVDVIDAALEVARNRNYGDGQRTVQLIRADILRMALAGEKARAAARVESELSFIFPTAKDRLRARISQM